MTVYCVCRGKSGLNFLKSGDDLDDVKRRAGGDATILTHGHCPARAVQFYFAQSGEVRGVEEKAVDLIKQAIGWSECPPKCDHSSINVV